MIIFAACDKDDDNGSVTEPNLEGVWFGASDVVIPNGPAGVDFDMFFIEFDTDDFLLFTFLESSPTAGHKGNYSFDEENALTLNLTQNGSSDAYNWVNYVYQADGHIEFSPDGNSIEVFDPEGMEPLGVQSGTFYGLGEHNRKHYLLFRLTYCTLAADGDSDYYHAYSYELSTEGDILTLWIGDYGLELVRDNS